MTDYQIKFIITFIIIFTITIIIIVKNYPEDWRKKDHGTLVITLPYVILTLASLVFMLVENPTLKIIGYFIMEWLVSTASMLLLRNAIKLMKQFNHEHLSEKVTTLIFSHLAGIVVAILCYGYIK